jgi:hypothetical protein
MPPPMQGSEVFIKEDLRNILRSIVVTHELAMRQSVVEDADAYRRGFMSAITAMSVATDIALNLPHRHAFLE